MTENISQHYSNNLQEAELLINLAERYPEGPTTYQLAPIDQLHIGGIKASEKLLQRLDEIRPKRILEIGSGLGGLMRLINNRQDCTLMGIDITHRFNRLNQQLTRLNSRNKAATTLTADAQQLPFTDGSFDCIILQHSLLNIPDTHECLKECYRVLSNDGTLLLHEVLQGPNPELMRYPVPWAQSAEHSHLITPHALTALLSDCGFASISSNNWSEDALQWRQRQAEKEESAQNNASSSGNDSSVNVISPQQVLGQQFRQMGPNVMENLTNGAVNVYEIVAQKITSCSRASSSSYNR